ncbi:unnamed protein product [Mytilus edulis]|uniref:Uncharacterized protein n=1 Tax=Mytilus edulis TaxID=6550 RepID=A0A8S3VL20_MYTED|nr:unnamed protein product [Mytilus edulis]
MSLEDKRALKMMESTIAYEDGHFKLGLPWRNENVKLPKNLPLAHARLNQLHRKLSHDPKLHEMYTATVSDYIQKGYAKEVTDVSNESSHIWYLPHHPVTNEHKPGKLGWDNPIPKENEEEWIKWKSTLPEIENISILRCKRRWLREYLPTL